MDKRIAIIGSGASGIAAIKCCLDEGLVPVCFERTDYMGGLWNYHDEVKDGQSCVMKTTVINTSKETMAYSDFPIPADFPIFMHNSRVQQYLEMYAKSFNAEKYTHFQTEVLSVKQTEKFSETGQWELEVRDPEGKTRTEIFDGVLVCTGHHADKNMPQFEGLEKFKGQVVHTHDYRTHEGYEGTNTLVVGIGNSGGDVTVELSRVCKQIYLSSRRGAWVLARLGSKGYPADMYSTRFKQFIRSLFPQSLFLGSLESSLNKNFDHEKYGLKPKHRVNGQHPTVNDELPNRIACGSIIVKPDIRRFTETGVEFVDGTFVDGLDRVIFATGFKFGFPVVKHPALEVTDNKTNLYKNMFPPDIRPCTLAVIGFIQPLGAIMPISEIQCRWATRVFKKLAYLPSKELMWDEIRKKKEALKKRYVQTSRHTIQVDFLPFMDEIAGMVGCKPDLGKLFWQDPALVMRLFFGPVNPFQYRLMGPGHWKGARQAVMTTWDRTEAGMHPQRTGSINTEQNNALYIIAVILIMFFVLPWLFGLFL